MARKQIADYEYDYSDSEPSKKRNKLQNKSKNAMINALPFDVCYKIFEYLNYEDLLNIRATSRQLRENISDFMKHYCLKKQKIKINKLCEESNKIIKLATQLFVKYGYEEYFYLHFYSNLKKSKADVAYFLYNFYGHVNSLKRNKEPKIRLIFVISVLLMILQFKDIEIQPPISASLHWRITFKVIGPGMGLLTGDPPSRHDIEKRNDLIVIIAEMLYCEWSRENFRKIFNGNEIYSIRTGSFFEHIPETTITLTVFGNKNIKRLLESVINQRDFNPFIQKLPGSEFTAYFDIYSQLSTSWGCNLQFEIGPLQSISAATNNLQTNN